MMVTTKDVRVTFLLREDNISTRSIMLKNIITSMWVIQYVTKKGLDYRKTAIVMNYNVLDVSIKIEKIDDETKKKVVTITKFTKLEDFLKYVNDNENQLCIARAKMHEDREKGEVYATDIIIESKKRASFGPKYSVGNKVIVSEPYTSIYTILSFRMLYNNFYQYTVADHEGNMAQTEKVINGTTINIPLWVDETTFRKIVE